MPQAVNSLSMSGSCDSGTVIVFCQVFQSVSGLCALAVQTANTAKIAMERIFFILIVDYFAANLMVSNVQIDFSLVGDFINR